MRRRERCRDDDSASPEPTDPFAHRPLFRETTRNLTRRLLRRSVGASMSARHEGVIDRRSLLHGAASIGAGTLGSGVLSACYKPCPPFGQWNNAVSTQSA